MMQAGRRTIMRLLRTVRACPDDADRMDSRRRREVPVEALRALPFKLVAKRRQHGVVKGKHLIRIAYRQIEMMDETAHDYRPCTTVTLMSDKAAPFALLRRKRLPTLWPSPLARTPGRSGLPRGLAPQRRRPTRARGRAVRLAPDTKYRADL